MLSKTDYKIIYIYIYIMAIISVIILIVNSINTGTMLCNIYIQFRTYFFKYKKPGFPY